MATKTKTSRTTSRADLIEAALRADRARARAERAAAVPTVGEEWASDVLSTAIEGGINYWASCVTAHGDAGSVVIRHDHPQESDDPAARHTIATLDRALLQFGVERLLGGKVQVAPEIVRAIRLSLSPTADAGDVDASAADVIVQVALFGEIVYG